jgi:Fic family protein
VTALSAHLGKALHPKTAASLARMVRIMNTYYSNLIEGHATRPRDIEQALLSGTAWSKTDDLPPQTAMIEAALQKQNTVPLARRDLLIEAVAHVRVQEKIDAMFASGNLPEPASIEFIRFLHQAFYEGASEAMLTIKSGGNLLRMYPGKWRAKPEEDVAVGRHVPPSSERVAVFMDYFEKRFQMKDLGRAAKILAIPAAHHRFNFIHPFLDGNGRVSRLMSHAMAHVAGIGAGGLWSVSRGLARGLSDRSEYKLQMDRADMPRQGSRDGRGNLSEKALIDFSSWFLQVCGDQIRFMTTLFQFDALQGRLRSYVERSEKLKPETANLLEIALLRGELMRGDVALFTNLPERSGRRLLAEALQDGILTSDTPKGPVRLNFPAHTHEILFPRLFTSDASVSR